MSSKSQEENVVNFAVLTQARTGSNMLVSILDNHPEVKCFGEILNPRSAFGYENWLRKSPVRQLTDRYLRDYCHEKYLYSLCAVGPNDHKRAVGFKIIYPGQFDRWSSIRYYWRTHDFKIISLIRHNLLRKYLSSKIANLEEAWSAKEDRGKIVRIKVDISDLERVLARMDTVYRLINDITVEFDGIQISYEELISDRETVMRTISQFLGIQPFEKGMLKAKTVKQNPAALEELIENYDEVCSALRDTQYEWFLKEPGQAS
jgi:LPS sulfotransferase NodH